MLPVLSGDRDVCLLPAASSKGQAPEGTMELCSQSVREVGWGGRGRGRKRGAGARTWIRDRKGTRRETGNQ